eukprot:CAMPEP_0173451546 /NCGR_PEP_ID=MMETSP1357-20121228/46999_1 /TAXON_ID=77926 /ORGANISM="Hemiselmis rufescens, Strain PCC563" /LENGTH=54 /DNA_ID=CAMNT_0014418319 /DNA_START=99 /DNA_END=260 /DNA_ORIENTATION=+
MHHNPHSNVPLGGGHSCSEQFPTQALHHNGSKHTSIRTMQQTKAHLPILAPHDN